MEEKENKELGTAPVGKLLWKLALPAVTAQLINMLYNLVDRIYIGHMPGDGALALTGVGVCLPVIMVVAAFAALVSMGGAPRASIFMGKGEPETAEKILGNCFALQVIISLILTVILELFGRPMLLKFGASANTIDYAADYLAIYAIGTIFVQLTLGMNAFITAQGFAKIGMYTVLIGAAANIILDPILIFVCRLGVRGAALATILSQCISAVWAVHFLLGKKTYLKLKRKNMRLESRIIMPCLGLGIAPFIMQASESVLSVCFNASLLVYGGDVAVGAMTILSSVMQFAMLPLQGIAQGAQPITSYNYGAKNKDRVKKSFFTLLKASLFYSLLIWALIMLFPGVFAAVFSSDTELVAFTARALRIYAAALGLMGIQIACQMTFISLGKALCSVIVAIMRKFILLIPLIFVFPLIFSADPTTAVYLAEPVADICAVTFTAVLFFFEFRKALKTLS